MKKHILLFLFFVVLSCGWAYAQKGKPTKTQPTQKPQTFRGTLFAKQWSKSIQSYCAQGSDYQVLRLSDEQEVVLENLTRKNLADFNEKRVEIRGYYQKKRIKTNDEGQSPTLEQRPDTGGSDFECEVLVVQTIRVL